MSATESLVTTTLSKRRTYRWLMFGSVYGGVAVGLGLRYFDYPVVGEAVYWVGILAFVAIWKGSDVQLIDERDWALERRASLSALQIVGAVMVVVASGSRCSPGSPTTPSPRSSGARCMATSDCLSSSV